MVKEVARFTLGWFGHRTLTFCTEQAPTLPRLLNVVHIFAIYFLIRVFAFSCACMCFLSNGHYNRIVAAPSSYPPPVIVLWAGMMLALYEEEGML